MTTAFTSTYFAALEALCGAGVPVRPVSQVDALAAESTPAVMLKHDVHGVDPDDLVKFARREASLGIRATFLFMPPGHPVTVSSYDLDTQCTMMREILAIGHEVGLHLDPYHLVQDEPDLLEDSLRSVLNRFAERGIEMTVGTTHGNTQDPNRDIDGYETAMDFFSETARHDDFPTLSRVPESSAALIREHRTSLAESGFYVWADLPVWSSASGFTATNYLTDKWLEKRSTFRMHVFEETRGAYYRTERQPPGGLNRPPGGQQVAVSSAGARQLAPGVHELPIDAEVFINLLDHSGALPLLFLAHPQFYA